MGRRVGAKVVLPELRKAKGLPDLPGQENLPVHLKGKCECPEEFDDDLKATWQRYIDPLYWLTTADETKAVMWCHLRREFLKDPVKMLANRIRELRLLGSELGLDPDARTRISTGGKKPKDDFSKFT